MSTATLYRTEHRVVLTVNRDVAVDAPPEKPPVLARDERFAAALLYPSEASRAGTWICGNSLGLIGTILPAHNPKDDERRASGGFRSRGSLLLRLFAFRHAGEAIRWLLDENDPNEYGSYMLLLASRDGCWLVEWRGEEAPQIYQPQGDWMMATTSAWRSSEVRTWRRHHFMKWLEKGPKWQGEIPTFHLYQPEDAKAWAPLAEQPQASTRSITQFDLQHGRSVTARYWRTPGKAALHADSETELALDPRAL